MNKKENLPEWFKNQENDLRKFQNKIRREKMTDETRKYLRSQEKNVQTPEEVGMTNKLLEIVNIINDKLTPEQRGEFFNGNLNTKNQLIDQYLDFIRLTLKYLLFDNEALKREIVELHSLLEGDDGCDLAN
jgi:hypothetical protein